jgi:hypothetical protein
MDYKKPYAPPRLTLYDPEKPPESRKRLYTRYIFTADAEIGISGVATSAKVMNISFGGCRLLINGYLEVGAAITIKIRTLSDSFEATAKVVHVAEHEAGVMFDKFTPLSLFVLQKWINAAKSAPPLATPNS